MLPAYREPQHRGENRSEHRESDPERGGEEAVQIAYDWKEAR